MAFVLLRNCAERLPFRAAVVRRDGCIHDYRVRVASPGSQLPYLCLVRGRASSRVPSFGVGGLSSLSGTPEYRWSASLEEKHCRAHRKLSVVGARGPELNAVIGFRSVVASWLRAQGGHSDTSSSTSSVPFMTTKVIVTVNHVPTCERYQAPNQALYIGCLLCHGLARRPEVHGALVVVLKGRTRGQAALMKDWALVSNRKPEAGRRTAVPRTAAFAPDPSSGVLRMSSAGMGRDPPGVLVQLIAKGGVGKQLHSDYGKLGAVQVPPVTAGCSRMLTASERPGNRYLLTKNEPSQKYREQPVFARPQQRHSQCRDGGIHAGVCCDSGRGRAA
ncbi:hypothetical protein H920_10492 [Fukomys damarensis]|uniref:Uncharacterized protein n=1 Tax=Fukomys damarensis TaxID=885580 RepID=A0A091DC96_FUKDA|nr:hypothetical protein H920_10492 [Fukomys damarensis]